jgi:hypothetical protein
VVSKSRGRKRGIYAGNQRGKKDSEGYRLSYYFTGNPKKYLARDFHHGGRRTPALF